MTEIEAMREEIKSLRDEVARLRAELAFRPVTIQTYPVYVPQPYYPPSYPITWCSDTADTQPPAISYAATGVLTPDSVYP